MLMDFATQLQVIRPEVWMACLALLVLTAHGGVARSAPDTIASSAGPIEIAAVAEGLDHPWAAAFLPGIRGEGADGS